MHRVRLFVAVAAAAVLVLGAAPPSSAGRDVGPRIVNGEIVSIQEVPWQVALLSSNNPVDFQAQFCGGSIIDPEWILTAAHCVVEGGDVVAPGSIEVLAGITDLATTEGTSGPRTALTQITAHPAYNPGTTNNDVALLKLSTPLSLDGIHRKAVALPLSVPSGWPSAGTAGVVSGWGTLDPDGPDYPVELHGAAVDVLTDPAAVACGDYAVGSGGYQAATMLCAGTVVDPIHDTCSGDSGGPLAIDRSGTWTLAGVTSWGMGCADPDYPGLYARVTTFTDWISATMAGGPTVPSAPTNLTGVAGDRKVTVSFVAPAQTGGAPITGYQYSLDGGVSWASAGTAASPVIITGLINTATYFIRLRAVNSVGPGPSSAPLGISLPAVPTATPTPSPSPTVTPQPTPALRQTIKRPPLRLRKGHSVVLSRTTRQGTTARWRSLTKKTCKVSGSKLRGKRKGPCRVTVHASAAPGLKALTVRYTVRIRN